MIRIFKTSLSSSSDSPEGLTTELGQQTSLGRRGFGPKSSGHRSPGGGASILSNKRLTLPFLALLAVLTAGLLFLLPGGLLQAQDSTTIEYPENGKDPVATLTATDPEMDTVMWSVGGTDTEDFDISEDGVLTFDVGGDGGTPDVSVSPDFEDAGDSDSDNTYVVTVTATDSRDSDLTDMFTVTVKVTNVDETGKVTWGVDHDTDTYNPDTYSPNTAADTPKLTQFQVGAILSVAPEGGVTDGDVSTDNKNVTERLQWYRSPNKTAMGTAIDGATSASYLVMTEDIGKYIRVEAFYNVGTGREESASLTSDYPVLGSRTSNEEPEFDPATITREVSEGKKGMTVGTPVRATDDITNALNYTLTGGADQTKFEIDQKTGQITTMVDLDFDSAAGAGDNCEALNSCVVQVTATDSAGSVSDPVATVTIKITDVNEKPTFDDATGNPTSITIPENSMALFGTTDDGYSIDADTGVTYTAMDEEGRSLTYRPMGTGWGQVPAQLHQGSLLQSEARLREASGREQGQRVRADRAGLGRHDVR